VTYIYHEQGTEESHDVEIAPKRGARRGRQ
jgi:hypothetical protein